MRLSLSLSSSGRTVRSERLELGPAGCSSPVSARNGPRNGRLTKSPGNAHRLPSQQATPCGRTHELPSLAKPTPVGLRRRRLPLKPMKQTSLKPQGACRENQPRKEKETPKSDQPLRFSVGCYRSCTHWFRIPWYRSAPYGRDPCARVVYYRCGISFLLLVAYPNVLWLRESVRADCWDL